MPQLLQCPAPTTHTAAISHTRDVLRAGRGHGAGAAEVNCSPALFQPLLFSFGPKHISFLALLLVKVSGRPNARVVRALQLKTPASKQISIIGGGPSTVAVCIAPNPRSSPSPAREHAHNQGIQRGNGECGRNAATQMKESRYEKIVSNEPPAINDAFRLLSRMQMRGRGRQAASRRAVSGPSQNDCPCCVATR